MDPQRFELCADQISRLVDYDDYSIATRGRTKNRLRHFWTPSKGRTNIAESTIIREEEDLCCRIFYAANGRNKTLLLGRV